MPQRSGDQIRIGVAIPVPDPFAAGLQGARARFGDPLADAIPPHVTLLGPTVVEPGDMAAVSAHLERVAADADPFTLHLRGTGSFRPVSPVVFVQVAQGIAHCERLERAVRSGPLEQPLRFNYHPHVTVAHEVPDEALDRAYDELAHYEARFAVPSFQVYEHGDDGVWRPVRDFPLDGGAPAAVLAATADARPVDAS
ncbi:phosphoesterase [Cellulomonas aerilata]|uniref:Phosphoesterase n=1 Tax=Cellulomonas aerilata TaxID=515326 RepID=A0A512DE43_9CELL|nr:phosphoesterase [Cellulomonas aerilata]